MSTVSQYKSLLFNFDNEIIDVVIYLDDKLLSSTDNISPDCTVILILNRISNNIIDDSIFIKNYDEQNELIDSDEDYYDDLNNYTELIDYFLPDYYK